MYLFIVFILYFGISSDPKISRQDLVSRHWAGSCNNMNCDTITFSSHKKFDAQFYRWGGSAEGFEFYKDGTASTFHNVHCSDESSPVDSYTSTWTWKGKDSLIIDNRVMNIIYKVIHLNKKELQMLQLSYTIKN